MKKVHCRKCWQPIPLLARRCAQCGDVDGFRFGKGVVQILFYVAVGAAVIGLGWWAASFHFHNSDRITAIGLTELQATTRVPESIAPAISGAGNEVI